MKINIDLKAGFLQSLKREVLAALNAEERAVIEVSTGEMGNKPDAVKLGWLKMRTGEVWTKQRYSRALKKTMEKLRDAVARESERQGLSAGFAASLPSRTTTLRARRVHKYKAAGTGLPVPAAP